MIVDINRTRYNLPSNFLDLTMKQYERICTADLNDEPTIVSILLECPVELIYELPVSVYNDIIVACQKLIKSINLESIKPENSVIIDNVKYTINYGDELSVAEYLDTRDQGMTDILSVVLRPVGEKYSDKRCAERKEMFGNMKVRELLPLIAFFLKKRGMYLQGLSLSSNLVLAQNLCATYTRNLIKTFGPLTLLTLLPMVKLQIMNVLSKWSWGQRLLFFFTKRKSQRQNRHRTNTRNRQESKK